MCDELSFTTICDRTFHAIAMVVMALDVLVAAMVSTGRNAVRQIHSRGTMRLIRVIRVIIVIQQRRVFKNDLILVYLKTCGLGFSRVSRVSRVIRVIRVISFYLTKRGIDHRWSYLIVFILMFILLVFF